MTSPIIVDRRTIADIATMAPMVARHLASLDYVARVFLRSNLAVTETWESKSGTLYYIAGSRRLLERYFATHPNVKP